MFLRCQADVSWQMQRYYRDRFAPGRLTSKPRPEVGNYLEQRPLPFMSRCVLKKHNERCEHLALENMCTTQILYLYVIACGD